MARKQTLVKELSSIAVELDLLKAKTLGELDKLEQTSAPAVACGLSLCAFSEQAHDRWDKIRAALTEISIELED